MKSKWCVYTDYIRSSQYKETKSKNENLFFNLFKSTKRSWSTGGALGQTQNMQELYLRQPFCYAEEGKK